MAARQERAEKLIGKTILLDSWDENFTFTKTFRVDLVGKVRHDLIYQVWSWPEKKEHLCLIGEFTWIQNGELVERTTKAIVFNTNLNYERIIVKENNTP